MGESVRSVLKRSCHGPQEDTSFAGVFVELGRGSLG